MSTPDITGDIDAKFAEIDERLAKHEAWLADHEARITNNGTRIGALEKGSAPAPQPPQPQRLVNDTEPTAANTGGGSNRTRAENWDGDLVCQANTVYENINVRKGHVILAPGCTVKRVTATGRFSGAYYSAIFWGNGAEGALVEDCVARPTAETARVSLNGFGWNGKGFTARWNDISGVTDYFHGTGDDMVMEANYGHHYAFNSSDPDQAGGWSHPDGVQVLGGARPRINGNSFWMNYDSELSKGVEALLANAYYTTAWGGGYGNIVTFSFKSGNIKDWEVRSNWMRGAEVAVQLPKLLKGYDTGNDGKIGGNRIFVDTANRWHGGTSKHHFRQDSGTGTVVNTAPDIAAETGKQLPGTYAPLSIKTPV